MLAHIVTYFRIIKGKEDKERINERFGQQSNSAMQKLKVYNQFCKKKNIENKIVWIHAVSVGESLSVIEFVKKISKKGYFIVFTTTTITSAKIISNKLPKNSVHQYCAFQTKKYIKKFLNNWQPNLVFFTESEIFPSIINTLYKQKIPFYLLNARLSDKSFKLWKLVKFYIKHILNKYSYIFPLSKQEQDKFKILSNNQAKIKYLGNLKFDSAIASKCNVNSKIPECESILDKFKKKIIIVFGSIHEEEYNFILKQYKKIINSIDCIGIFVPRYIENCAKLEEKALKSNLKPIYIDKLPYSKNKEDLVIVNKMNVLKNMYKICNIAVICGSFAKKIGGHNPIESIVFNKPTFIGKYCNKTQDLIDCLTSYKVIFQTNDLYSKILYLLNKKDFNTKLKKNIKHLIKKHKNVSDKIIKLLKL